MAVLLGRSKRHTYESVREKHRTNVIWTGTSSSPGVRKLPFCFHCAPGAFPSVSYVPQRSVSTFLQIHVCLFYPHIEIASMLFVVNFCFFGHKSASSSRFRTKMGGKFLLSASCTFPNPSRAPRNCGKPTFRDNLSAKHNSTTISMCASALLSLLPVLFKLSFGCPSVFLNFPYSSFAQAFHLFWCKLSEVLLQFSHVFNKFSVGFP